MFGKVKNFVLADADCLQGYDVGLIIEVRNCCVCSALCLLDWMEGRKLVCLLCRLCRVVGHFYFFF